MLAMARWYSSYASWRAEMRLASSAAVIDARNACDRSPACS